MTAPTAAPPVFLQLLADRNGKPAGLGFGFLPEPCARKAIAEGRLVEKQVEEPKPDETFYLAWRTGEEGAALSWWIKRMRQPGVFDHLCRFLSS